MDKLTDMLVRHEGKRRMPYTCPGGKITIGVGHNIEDNGLSDQIIHAILKEDIDNALRDLYSIFPLLSRYGEARRAALIDMMFNLGLPRFTSFKRMISAIKENKWDMAAAEALDSKWAVEVRDRAQEIAYMFRTDCFREEA